MSLSLLFRYGDNLIEGAATVVNNAKKANQYLKLKHNQELITKETEKR